MPLTKKKTKSLQGHWEAPEDIKKLLKDYPVTKVRFSIALLRARYPSFDETTKRRAEKVIDCLMRDRPYR